MENFHSLRITPCFSLCLVCLLVFSHGWEEKNNLEFVITHNLYKWGSKVLRCQINSIRSINLIFLRDFIGFQMDFGLTYELPELYLQDFGEINFLLCFFCTDCTGQSIPQPLFGSKSLCWAPIYVNKHMIFGNILIAMKSWKSNM